ncbi:GNAT family N-acetyltransferase [Roseomonas populi]|uniref:GNAT family N-acetyltransferase n=1 Tax=Roseomonas populi TaxID=3121582 RepID=A0ABT1XBN2_9PROT|nr:GNAT family N-acetyltransferase [Roseomonas pecuniae]MCR0985119.1 GNAT family N-acetyltransferase [Roseomonas pecuniae]
MQITAHPVRDLAQLGADWRALEAEAACSFFQSWSWVGCLAEERYDDPVLLRGRQDGRDVALALFNRRRGRLHLAESGDPALDAPFIEHNAPLVAAQAPEGTGAALLRAAWAVSGARRLVLAGTEAALAEAAGGTVLRWQERPAPLLDLAAVRASGGGYLATRSANTRQQLRRSARAFERRGPLRLERAEDAGQALQWFERLRELHERTWKARGRPGAFATPFLLRFHRALIAAAAVRDELDMLRVTAGGAEVGYLYNFRLGGRVSAYQSGLAPTEAGSPEKPGLTCHAMAVERALEAGDAVYDFLAGDAQYKRSLANGAGRLVWSERVPVLSPLGLAAGLRRLLKV